MTTARPAASVELLYDGDVVRVEADDVLVGRTATCTVRVVHPLVSREHCRLEPRADGLYVVDLGAVNGTWLNGVRVAGRARARTGDRLGLGREGAILVVQRALVDGVDVAGAVREEDKNTMVVGDPRAAGIVARVEVAPAARPSAKDDPTCDANEIPVIPAMPTGEISRTVTAADLPTMDAAPAAERPRRFVAGFVVGTLLGLAAVAVVARATPLLDALRGTAAR